MAVNSAVSGIILSFLDLARSILNFYVFSYIYRLHGNTFFVDLILIWSTSFLLLLKLSSFLPPLPPTFFFPSPYNYSIASSFCFFPRSSSPSLSSNTLSLPAFSYPSSKSPVMDQISSSDHSLPAVSVSEVQLLCSILHLLFFHACWPHGLLTKFPALVTCSPFCLAVTPNTHSIRSLRILIIRFLVSALFSSFLFLHFCRLLTATF